MTKRITAKTLDVPAEQGEQQKVGPGKPPKEFQFKPGESGKGAATPSNLEGAYGGLHLGAGSDLALGTFFSGLIDDVRIYNRAVTP